MSEAEKILQNIVSQGVASVVSDEDRKMKMVEQGSRIPNIVLKKTVKKLRADKMPEDKILDKILFFDELAEKGELIDYLGKEGENG